MKDKGALPLWPGLGGLGVCVVPLGLYAFQALVAQLHRPLDVEAFREIHFGGTGGSCARHFPWHADLAQAFLEGLGMLRGTMAFHPVFPGIGELQLLHPDVAQGGGTQLAERLTLLCHVVRVG
jgi:hypothetical protein